MARLTRDIYPSIIVVHPTRGTAIHHTPLEAWNLMKEWSDPRYPARAYVRSNSSGFTYQADRWLSFCDYINGR